MADEHVNTAAFRGASFRASDMTGATFRDCDLSGVRIVSCQVDGLAISGFDGQAGSVVVDDVDVREFVAGELDRRHPERVQLRAVRSAEEFRAMWDTLERLWSDTVERARRLPEAALHERVDGEWSFVETVRHLVFAIDSWVGNLLLGEPAAYHPAGLPPTDYDPASAAKLGIDLDARLTLAQALAIHAERQATMRSFVGAVTDAELDDTRTGSLDPKFGDETFPVRECLGVVLNEHCEHRRYAERDLTKLETRQG